MHYCTLLSQLMANKGTDWRRGPGRVYAMNLGEEIGMNLHLEGTMLNQNQRNEIEELSQ